MSNHHHIIITDPHGRLPDFLRELHRTTAKALNASQGQWENFWSAEPANAVLLASAEDLLRKIAYVVANPVEAGLVEHPRAWPGVLLWGDICRTTTRPAEYFDAEGRAPATIELRVVPPDVCFLDWDQRLNAEIAGLVADAHRTMKAAGMGFLGRAAVLAASFVSRAKSYEVKRGIVPRIAAINRELRIKVLQIYRSFYSAYRDAVSEWRAGDRSVVFPAGTWWMRVHHNAAAEPPPLPA